MDTVQWDPSSVLPDFQAGLPEGTSPVYRDLLGKCPVAHIDAAAVDEHGTVDYWGILGFDELAAAAKDYKTFSSVTPVEGPRILPPARRPSRTCSIPHHAQSVFHKGHHLRD